MNEFDLGWKECYENTAIPLYGAIEDAIGFLEQTNKAYFDMTKAEILKALHAALKEADKK